MALFTRANRDLVWDWVFLVGVLLKALDGLLELVVGIPAVFLTADQVAALGDRLTARELAHDPHDLIATMILRESHRLSHDTLLIAGIYLIVHGVVKLAIVAALILGSRRVYPWAIGALSILLVVQLVDLVMKFSVGVLVLTLIDVAIIVLTVREWREGRTLRDVVRLRMPWMLRRARRAVPARGSRAETK